ncbi:MAG: Crp/Fnr family transcriptional regulator [Balneolaceae bacterium]|nr:Crp/Fnr family transcriptional regulator [Balneolaceae bacterium]
MDQDFLNAFPRFNDSDILQKHIEQCQVQEVPEGTQILDIGSTIRVVPFVIDGAVKVLRSDDEGHELYLYHIQAGESCAMTLTSSLSRDQSQVRAVTLEKTRLLAVPVGVIHSWYERDPIFQTFVLSTFQQRFRELLTTLDNVTFQHIDKRLIQLLSDRTTALERNILHVTHQELADELNSSREVVSRLLKQMEKKGMVELGRNRIKILKLM